MGESFTIQISSNLINRLASQDDKIKKKPKKPKQTTQRGHQQSQIKAHDKQTIDSTDAHKDTPNIGWPVFFPAPAPPAPVPNAELDAIRSVLKDSERVLERLQKQEANMVEEVTQRARELHDKEFKLPYQKPMPCLAEKDACMDCYKEHAKDPLKCADVVKKFADCSRKARQEVSSSS